MKKVELDKAMAIDTDMILDDIRSLAGDLERYPELAKEFKEEYRTLNAFLSDQLKEMKLPKGELAKKLGISFQQLNNWEKHGIPSLEQAFELALALKLNLEQTNIFLKKFAGRNMLYAADQNQAKYIYLLVFHEQLEEQFPYKESETIAEWKARVLTEKELAEAPIDANKSDKKSEETREATEYFLDAILSGDIERIQNLPYRSAGNKAIPYLDAYVKGTIFEERYGNRSHKEFFDEEEISVRNTVPVFDHIYRKEKDRYAAIRKKLETGEKQVNKQLIKKGELPHRDELIELGMLLRMTDKEMDELLTLCGEDTLSAKNIYEAALLMVWTFLSEMRPEWFGMKDSGTLIENEEEKLETLYKEYAKESYADYVDDVQVLASKKVGQAIGQLSDGFKDLIREVPSWYLTEEQQKHRMEQRRMAAVISGIGRKMMNIWEFAKESDGKYRFVENIIESKVLWDTEHKKKTMDCTFENYVRNILWLKDYEPLDNKTDSNILEMIQSIEDRWLILIKETNTLKKDRTEFKKICERLLRQMEAYYQKKYSGK